MYTHKCIKSICQNQYTEADPEAYYCPECREKNKVLASQIDKRLEGRSSRQEASFTEQITRMKKVGGVPIINL